MILKSELKIGADYKLSVFNDKGECKQSTDWLSNMILNGAAKTIIGGFLEEPTIEFGVNGDPVKPTDTGVKDRTFGLTYLGGEYISLDKSSPTPNTVVTNWIKRYTYHVTEQNAAKRFIREIGIEGFSRALVKDYTTGVSSVQVTERDTLVVEFSFTLTMVFPEGETTSNVVNSKGDVISQLTYEYEHMVSDDKGDWWELLNGYANTDKLVIGQVQAGDKVMFIKDIYEVLYPRGVTLKTSVAPSLKSASVDAITFGDGLRSVPPVKLKLKTPMTITPIQKLTFHLKLTW